MSMNCKMTLRIQTSADLNQDSKSGEPADCTSVPNFTMAAPAVFLSFLVLFVSVTLNPAWSSVINTDKEDRKIELYDGVTVKIPSNDTKKMVSLEINMNNNETGRGKTKKLMQKFMPMFILPFVIQSTIVPLFLGLLKFMLFKSLMIGKLALVLIIINAFKNSNSFNARRDEDIANLHYGYHGNGNEEYGSLFNHKY